MWLPNYGNETRLMTNEKWNCVGFLKNACMHVGGLLHWVAMEY